MRRILIDEKTANRANELAGVMVNNTPQKVGWHKQQMPLERLKRFWVFLRGHHFVREAQYVYTIIFYYDTLLKLRPDWFEKVYKIWFKRWDDILNTPIDYNNEKKEFYKHVIGCMRYKDIRSNLMRAYMKEQKIKACVYCNAQYAITTDEFVEDGERKRIGTYQFDHFMPASKYPFLCTSYYNLQPSCATCNGSKLQEEANFNLYTEKADEVEPFWFELTPDKAVMAYVNQDMDNIEVKLNSSDDELLNNHQDLFHIDQIYTQHIETVQRIIVMLRANSVYYMISLQESLDALFPMGVEDPESFFFGFHMKREHVHLQPLNMLVQDVVEVLRT